MAIARVIPHRLPKCPGVDSRFTIRNNDARRWWVFYEEARKVFVPADDPHDELIDLVNDLKVGMGGEPGGAFSINEHGQVIAKMGDPSGAPGSLHVIGLHRNQVVQYPHRITFKSGALDPGRVLPEGTPWPGPQCGMSYTFVAVGNPKAPSRNFDEVVLKEDDHTLLLSTEAGHDPYPPAAGSLADFLAALRRQLGSKGGRFRVNEQGVAFTSNEPRFIGKVPRDEWFPPHSARS